MVSSQHKWLDGHARTPCDAILLVEMYLLVELSSLQAEHCSSYCRLQGTCLMLMLIIISWKAQVGAGPMCKQQPCSLSGVMLNCHMQSCPALQQK